MIGCPDCGGMLTEVATAGSLLRFRCHTGHAYTAEALISQQDDAVDRALLSAVRMLEERSAMWTRLADRNDDLGNRRATSTMRKNAEESKSEADVLRDLINSRSERVSARS
jgi:two-component system chemotaxis response regulator CheB